MAKKVLVDIVPLLNSSLTQGSFTEKQSFAMSILHVLIGNKSLSAHTGILSDPMFLYPDNAVWLINRIRDCLTAEIGKDITVTITNRDTMTVDRVIQFTIAVSGYEFVVDTVSGGKPPVLMVVDN